MSWVYYADRKPTEADAGVQHQIVLVRFANGWSDVRYWNSYGDDYVAWMDIKDLPPLPPRKIWRTPTYADLDKATEPIPCRCRDILPLNENAARTHLVGILKWEDRRFVTKCRQWRYCEIEVDA